MNEMVKENLARWRDEGRLIGFSPSRDADRLEWGIVSAVGPSWFEVREISALGLWTGISRWNISDVSYFTDDDEYAERLRRIIGFVATLPDSDKYVKSRSAIKAVLIEAAETGEVISILRRDEQLHDAAKVLKCDGSWVELEIYTDLMIVHLRQVWRVSAIEEVRWRTATEEVEERLRKRAET